MHKYNRYQPIRYIRIVRGDQMSWLVTDFTILGLSLGTVDSKVNEYFLDIEVLLGRMLQCLWRCLKDFYQLWLKTFYCVKTRNESCDFSLMILVL